MSRILITCGETSGEEHAARLVAELLGLDPASRITALGGEILAAAGAETAFPMKDLAFMGFSEIVRGIPKVLSLEKKLRRLLAGGEIDLFIPVDYPGLNLRLARYARRKGVPVLYFISPQVWAWGAWRIARIKRSVDLMGVILPFEEKIYRDAGVPVFFAGHPLTDAISTPERPKEAPGRGSSPRILLFPGSRQQEVDRILPPMLSAAGRILERFPGARFVIGLAPLISEDAIKAPAGLEKSLTMSREGIGELPGSSLVIAASGTATLQSALSGTPTVVVYRTSAFTYSLGRNLVRIPFIAMPNVLAGKGILPELLQGEATGSRIASEAVKMLEDPSLYESVSSELIGLRKDLSKPGGLRELAERALEMAARR